MPFMAGVPWLWMLSALLIIAGLVAAIVSAFGVSGTDGDDALGILRARFARGEIDADEFDKARATLGPEPTRRSASRRLLLAAVGLLIAGALTAWLASAVVLSPGGMMGGMMGMMGAGPTAPPGTSVTMAGARFTPATIPIHAGGTVRWFNHDAMPHTVTAADRAWDSGNLAPGGSFERRFDRPGSYSYVCLYHSWMTGTVVVSSP
jgi:plastocyanin